MPDIDDVKLRHFLDFHFHFQVTHDYSPLFVLQLERKITNRARRVFPLVALFVAVFAFRFANLAILFVGLRAKPGRVWASFFQNDVETRDARDDFCNA